MSIVIDMTHKDRNAIRLEGLELAIKNWRLERKVEAGQ
jgi:hypothetical protein